MATAVEKKNVPANAMRFDAGRVEFAGGQSGTNTAPIKMLGRSAEPVNHWYWGEIIHDMDGFMTDHPTVPIDWCHDGTWEEGIGYLDTFKADNSGLNVSGELVSVKDDDRAATIMKKAAAKVPYQASIFFRAERIEQVMEGASAEVNGYTVDGPAIIVRQWALRGMAVCLYGADHRTNSQFSDGDEVAVDIFSSEGIMPKKPETPAVPETKLADQTPTTPAKAVAPATELAAATPAASAVPLTGSPAAELSDIDPRAELKKFVAKFGSAKAAEYFSDGLSFADALDKHVVELNAQLTAKQTEVDAANQKLASIDRGEPTPANFSDADQQSADAKKNDKFAHLGTNLSRFASSIKLPTPSKN